MPSPEWILLSAQRGCEQKGVERSEDEQVLDIARDIGLCEADSESAAEQTTEAEPKADPMAELQRLQEEVDALESQLASPSTSEEERLRIEDQISAVTVQVVIVERAATPGSASSGATPR